MFFFSLCAIGALGGWEPGKFFGWCGKALRQPRARQITCMAAKPLHPCWLGSAHRDSNRLRADGVVMLGEVPCWWFFWGARRGGFGAPQGAISHLKKRSEVSVQPPHPGLWRTMEWTVGRRGISSMLFVWEGFQNRPFAGNAAYTVLRTAKGCIPSRWKTQILPMILW